MAIPYNSNYDITVPFSDVSATFNLATGVAQTYTVPGASTVNYSARFGYRLDSNVLVCLNGTATTPGAGTNNSTQYQELNPGIDGSQRYVKGGDVLSISTPDASAYLSISLRQLN